MTNIFLLISIGLVGSLRVERQQALSLTDSLETQLTRLKRPLYFDRLSRPHRSLPNACDQDKNAAGCLRRTYQLLDRDLETTEDLSAPSGPLLETHQLLKAATQSAEDSERLDPILKELSNSVHDLGSTALNASDSDITILNHFKPLEVLDRSKAVFRRAIAQSEGNKLNKVKEYISTLTKLDATTTRNIHQSDPIPVRAVRSLQSGLARVQRKISIRMNSARKSGKHAVSKLKSKRTVLGSLQDSVPEYLNKLRNKIRRQQSDLAEQVRDSESKAKVSLEKSRTSESRLLERIRARIVKSLQKTVTSLRSARERLASRWILGNIMHRLSPLVQQLSRSFISNSHSKPSFNESLILPPGFQSTLRSIEGILNTTRPLQRSFQDSLKAQLQSIDLLSADTQNLKFSKILQNTTEAFIRESVGIKNMLGQKVNGHLKQIDLSASQATASIRYMSNESSLPMDLIHRIDGLLLNPLLRSIVRSYLTGTKLLSTRMNNTADLEAMERALNHSVKTSQSDLANLKAMTGMDVRSEAESVIRTVLQAGQVLGGGLIQQIRALLDEHLKNMQHIRLSQSAESVRETVGKAKDSARDLQKLIDAIREHSTLNLKAVTDLVIYPGLGNLSDWLLMAGSLEQGWSAEQGDDVMADNAKAAVKGLEDRLRESFDQGLAGRLQTTSSTESFSPEAILKSAFSAFDAAEDASSGEKDSVLQSIRAFTRAGQQLLALSGERIEKFDTGLRSVMKEISEQEVSSTREVADALQGARESLASDLDGRLNGLVSSLPGRTRWVADSLQGEIDDLERAINMTRSSLNRSIEGLIALDSGSLSHLFANESDIASLQYLKESLGLPEYYLGDFIKGLQDLEILDESQAINRSHRESAAFQNVLRNNLNSTVDTVERSLKESFDSLRQLIESTENLARAEQTRLRDWNQSIAISIPIANFSIEDQLDRFIRAGQNLEDRIRITDQGEVRWLGFEPLSLQGQLRELSRVSQSLMDYSLSNYSTSGVEMDDLNNDTNAVSGLFGSGLAETLQVAGEVQEHGRTMLKERAIGSKAAIHTVNGILVDFLRIALVMVEFNNAGLHDLFQATETANRRANVSDWVQERRTDLSTKMNQIENTVKEMESRFGTSQEVLGNFRLAFDSVLLNESSIPVYFGNVNLSDEHSSDQIPQKLSRMISDTTAAIQQDISNLINSQNIG